MIRVLAAWWLRAKQLERAEHTFGMDDPLAALDARLARMEQAIEATAIEVERISEAQRFTTKLLTEQGPADALVPRGQRTMPGQ